MTRGYRLVNSVATVATVPAAVIANAQPRRPTMTRAIASTSAAMATIAGSTGGKTFLSLRSTATATVQIRNPAATAAAGSDSLRAVEAARSQRAPVVRSVR